MFFSRGRTTSARTIIGDPIERSSNRKYFHDRSRSCSKTSDVLMILGFSLTTMWLIIHLMRTCQRTTSRKSQSLHQVRRCSTTSLKATSYFWISIMKRILSFQPVSHSNRVDLSWTRFPTWLDVIHCVRDLKQMLRKPLVIRHDNSVQPVRPQRTVVSKRKVSRTI
jgi:hypothetical protein